MCALLWSVMAGTEARADRQEDLLFLQRMLMEKKVQLLFKIHERLRCFHKRGPVPSWDHATTLVSDLQDRLSHHPSVLVQELLSLLCEPHFRGLLQAHDGVAQRQFEPHLPPLPENVLEESEESVRVVSLVKSAEPLGATIRRDLSTGAILVARVLRGGAAERSGLIHQGDQLKEVNGVPVERKTPEEILPLLASSKQEVKLKVIPADIPNEQEASTNEVFVRTLFDYDPSGDPAAPCKEAALAFRRGDILQVLSQEDDAWWQARRHGDSHTWAGLIPSEQLHQRRLALQQPRALFQSPCVQPSDDDEAAEEVDYGAISGIREVGRRRSFRLGRRGGCGTEGRVSSLGTPAGAPAYVEVVPYRRGPEEGQRLVLLVASVASWTRRSWKVGGGTSDRFTSTRLNGPCSGPPGVGVSELQRRLLVFDPDYFGVAVPHTSRVRNTKEQDGVDYHFVSERKFEEDILNHRFLEYGLYRGHYYGTSLDSVGEVMAEGKMCLLSVHPSTIRSVYTQQYRPYVVFVKPPRLEELRLTRSRAKVLCTPQEDSAQARVFSEQDFQDMIGSARGMETTHGHMFDKVVVNGDLATAFRELRAALEKVAGPDLQWTPAEWVQSPPAAAAGSRDQLVGRV